MALIKIEAQIVLERFGAIKAKSKRDRKDLEKAMRRSCYDKLGEIADLCEMASSFMGHAYADLLPKADSLCDGIGSGLRILTLAERQEIESFTSIMAKSTVSASGHTRDKSNLEHILSETGKTMSKISSLAAAASKASATYAKMVKRTANNDANFEAYEQFISVARETDAQLSAFNSIVRDMIAAQGKYSIAMVRLDSLLKEQQLLKDALSQLPDTTRDENILSHMRRELADIELLEPAVASELGRLQDRRKKKEMRLQAHAANRYSFGEWEKAKSSGDPIRPRFTYSKEPQIEPAMADEAEVRKQKFLEAALSLFKSSLDKNAMLREQFEATLPEIAELYLKGKGTITGKSLFARFPKRAKHEKVLRNDASDYDIVRIGLSSINEYRLLIDVKNPRQPLIYFVGHKEECAAFMKAMPKQISGCREKALSNGVGSLFSALSPE